MLGAIFLVLEFAAIAVYALLGIRLRALTRQARNFRIMNRISGALMIAFGCMLALARRPAT